jgi:nicotinate phosphoribosyltransferase
MVFKLVARRGDDGTWVSVAKKSADKATVGGRKSPVRVIVDGVATRELIRVGSSDAGPGERALHVPLVTRGQIDLRHTGPEGVARARLHRAAALAELPDQALRLGRGEPVVPTVYA